MTSESKACVVNWFKRIFLPSAFAFIAWLLVQFFHELKSPLSAFLNIEGTLLLAFAISFPQGPKGLRWWLCDSMNYGSTPSFSYVNFYLGIAALITGTTMGAIK